MVPQYNSKAVTFAHTSLPTYQPNNINFHSKSYEKIGGGSPIQPPPLTLPNLPSLQLNQDISKRVSLGKNGS